MNRTDAAVVAGCSVVALALVPGGPVLAAPQAPFARTGTLAVAARPFDFNGDGYAEIVIGAPYEDVGTTKDSGGVTVVPGSAKGPVYARATAWTQDSPDVPGAGEAGDLFGAAQTSGDYDSDGYADLLVGVPGERFGQEYAGAVTLLRGSPTGLTATGSATARLPSSGDDGYAAYALATGDFDGDGYDDVAVSDDANNDFNVVYGGSTGLQFPDPSDASLAWDYQRLPGELVDPGQALSWYVAAGDVNGDGYDDLAVSDPWSSEDHGYPTGAVIMIYGSADGLGADDAQRWTLDSPDIVGETHTGQVDGANAADRFGYQVVLGDVDGDGFGDLLVSSPGAPVVRAGVSREDAGALNLIRGSATGLTSDGNRQLTEQSPGMPGSAATDDGLGDTLAAADADGDGDTDLMVAVGGEASVIVLPGGSGFGSHGSHWMQNSPGVPGSDEPGDCFGCYARWVPTKGVSAAAQLVVGVPGEDAGAGVVVVFNTVGAQPVTSGIRAISQDTAGLPGGKEPDDWFGYL